MQNLLGRGNKLGEFIMFKGSSDSQSKHTLDDNAQTCSDCLSTDDVTNWPGRHEHKRCQSGWLTPAEETSQVHHSSCHQNTSIIWTRLPLGHEKQILIMQFINFQSEDCGVREINGSSASAEVCACALACVGPLDSSSSSRPFARPLQSDGSSSKSLISFHSSHLRRHGLIPCK